MSVQIDFLITQLRDVASVNEKEKEIIILRETFMHLMPHNLRMIQHLMKFDFELIIHKK